MLDKKSRDAKSAKAILEATNETKESKEFYAIKKQYSEIMMLQREKEAEEHSKNKCKHRDTLHKPDYGKNSKDAGQQIILNGCAEA